jgi:Aspartate/tyrosine/aromatic aminotransferase
MLAPASGFYTSPNLGKDEVRIAFVLNSDKLMKAINIIRLALKEYKD